jgi:UDP-glucose 4-epimerase
VVLADLALPPVVPDGVEPLELDICGSRQALDDHLAGADIVCNLAGRSGQVTTLEDPAGSLDVNVRGSLQVLQSVRRVAPAARLVFTSSRLVYGRPRTVPVTAEHPTRPTSFYGAHKLAAEHQHRLFGIHHSIATTVLRLTNPYGPRRPGATSEYGIVNWFCERALAGEDLPVYGRGEQLRDYLYLDDAIEALLLAAVHDAAPGTTYDVGGGTGIRFVDMAREVLRAVAAVRPGGQVRFLPWPEPASRLETGGFVADITPIRQQLGWQPRTSLAEGLRHTVAHYRQETGA